jgi:hypothetical protein
MAKLKIAHKSASGTLHDQKTSPTAANVGGYYGGTGGENATLTTTGVKTILIEYNTASNVQVADGYVVAQKGIRKFLAANVATASVKTSVYTAKVTLVNAATDNNRAANQGTISCYTPANVAFNASRITNKYVYDFNTPRPNRYRYVLSDVVAGNGFANVASA